MHPTMKFRNGSKNWAVVKNRKKSKVILVMIAF